MILTNDIKIQTIIIDFLPKSVGKFTILNRQLKFKCKHSTYTRYVRRIKIFFKLFSSYLGITKYKLIDFIFSYYKFTNTIQKYTKSLSLYICIYYNIYICTQKIYIHTSICKHIYREFRLILMFRKI